MDSTRAHQPAADRACGPTDLSRDASQPEALVPCAQCAVYRDIFAEITFKAKPLCRNANDPEWVTAYEIPVGPIHRAAGRLSFQMFNGEWHMARLMDELRELRRRVA